MPVCQFCDHLNAAGRRSCEKCGAELEQEAEPTLSQRPATDGWKAEVVGFLRNRQKIAAIKRYREETGVGLREAKVAVEKWEVELGLPVAPRSGCLSVLLLTAAVSAAVVSALVATRV